VETGIQAVFDLQTKMTLDAGVRRHDELSRCLKARDFNHLERDIESRERCDLALNRKIR
jgi:hypothetical protein